MAARCASCSYPLSVSDSVSCYECSSYFHIDCAQLVGFPYYELSGNYNKNIFHCTTCKILPLPKQRYESDSDSDCDPIMPSRQIDYDLDSQSDFIRIEMNEVKITVQDLSELCKDMLREINEIKSINLTLRCCVENLRLENEQRDCLIAELKKRIEIVEEIQNNRVFKPVEVVTVDSERFSEKEDDTERYLTPDPDYAKVNEPENLRTEDSLLNEPVTYSRNMTPTDNANEPSENSSEWESSNSVGNACIVDRRFESYDFEQNRDMKISLESELNFSEEELIKKSTEELNENIGTENQTSERDRSLEENEMVQLKNYDENEKTFHDYMSQVIDDTEIEDWEMLNEEEKSEFIRYNVGKYSKTVESVDEELEETDSAQEENVENKSEEESEGQFGSEEYLIHEERTKQKRVTWVEELGKDNEDDSCNEEHMSLDHNEENSQEVSNFGTNSMYKMSYTGEDNEEKKSVTDEVTDITSLSDADVTVKSEVEGVGGKTAVEGANEGVRLDGEQGGEIVARGESLPEGEVTVVQSPVLGVVQAEPSQGSEVSPPPPPEPQHSPDDLWDYLKETVSEEHPTTVEEFVQKLIGTLEHVPEEYLKPVIDANIKRATTPSVTDEEHLNALEEEVHANEQTYKEGETSAQEGEVTLTEDSETLTQVTGEEAQEALERIIHEEEPGTPETVTDTRLPLEPTLLDDQTESVEDYTALQATD